MKKLMLVFVALSFLGATTAVSFAADAPPKKEKKAKKKGKKKTDDTTKKFNSGK